MSELREKVAREIIDFIEAPDASEECTAEEFANNVRGLADRILDIPEIRAAKIVAEASPEWIEEHFGAELAAAILGSPPAQS